MKRVLKRLLAIFGLAPASAVTGQAQLAAELRAGSIMWKTKAGEAIKRLKARDAEAKRDAHALEKLKAANDKLRERQDEIENMLRKRLIDAERELVMAREQLMAIDVKLDILEGAANVLDSRTRAAVSKQHASTVARV